MSVFHPPIWAACNIVIECSARACRDGVVVEGEISTAQTYTFMPAQNDRDVL